MSKQNTSSKGFAPWRWLKRMFFGASKEYTLADERYDSPGKLAVKRFFRNPLAVIALTILVGMFLFVFIGPIFAPVDLTETGSEMLHVNVRPTMSLMKLPDDMKDGAVDISSRGTFTIGVSTGGNMYTWGYYTHTKDPKLNPLNIPDEVKNAKIVHAAAGTDHAVAISEDGHVYAWGAYDNGQYGWDGSMIASARKQPEELMGDNTIDASQVRQLVAGNQVTAILMEDGTIYAWGNDGGFVDADGNWIGFDADMAKAFAESLGVTAEFQLIEWDNKVMELDGKTIDVVWNGMTLTDEVISAMSCSNAYCNNAQVVVLPADIAADYPDVESMASLNFAVESGSFGQAQAEANGFTFTEVVDQATALMEVASGTADAAIIDSLMAGAMVGDGTSYTDLTYTITLNPNEGEQYGVGFRQGSDLTEALNQFFVDSYADGTMMDLATTYGVQAAIIPQE